LGIDGQEVEEIVCLAEATAQDKEDKVVKAKRMPLVDISVNLR
jgi:hypothetical protein